LPDDHHQILGGGIPLGELRDVQVEVAVVQVVDHATLHDFLHGVEVGHEPCCRIDLTLDRHLQLVVVAMVVRVVARAEDAPILVV
jgi:hypothetical protein